jgi:hypothetical protein
MAGKLVADRLEERSREKTEFVGANFIRRNGTLRRGAENRKGREKKAQAGHSKEMHLHRSTP